MPHDRIAALARIARDLGADNLSRDAVAVAARTAENRFFVACVGQFKRGKSTLINALLGDDLLPTGVVPVTSVITVVRSGEELRPIVYFLDGSERVIRREEIAEFVSEELNPRNRKGVESIEIESPAELLKSGMCLVDTPGLGSVFEANSEVTRRFVPHIDAAIVVLGADPPISGDEAALTSQVARQVRDLIFVLNKADRLTDGEVEEARAFCERTLRSRLQGGVEILTVSALQRTRDWSKLQRRVAALPANELVQSSRQRAIRRLTALLLREIDERRRALAVPLDETERRLRDIRQRIDDVQRSLDDLTFLFASEQQKLSRTLSAKRETFLSRKFGRPADHDHARTMAEDAITEWSRQLEPEAEEMFAAATERFVAPLRSLADVDIERRLARSRFFFASLPELTGRSWFRRRNPEAYFRRLLETNSARLINDVIDRFVESRRGLERDVAGALEQIGASSGRAADAAREALSHGREHAAAELARLDALSRESSSLLEQDSPSF